MAHGQPVVSTPCAVEGMHLRDGHDVLVADDAAAFADVVVRLHEDEALWTTLSRNGLDNRSDEHPSELQSLMRISYAVFCLHKNNSNRQQHRHSNDDKSYIPSSCT